MTSKNEAIIYQELYSLRENEKQMKETILDLQCRNMRDNLIFFGLPEAEFGHVENCQDTISKFIKMNERL